MSLPLFPENSRVVFLGDSLTSCGLWPELIFDHYTKVCPERNVRIYNAAIGGSDTEYTYRIRNEDLYSFKPTDAVLTFGVNDMGHFGGRSLEERKELFKKSLIILCEDLISNGIRLYFCAEFRQPVNYEADNVVGAREVVFEVAQKYGAGVCDFFELMYPYELKKDLFVEDRVHPSRDGETVLAKLFLNQQGFDGFPLDDTILDDWDISRDSDHRWIFDNKIRRIRLTEKMITMHGDTVAERIKDLKQRVYFGEEGRNWSDFYYFRAMDYIELAQNIDDYMGELERITDRMIAKSLEEKKAK